MNSTDHIRACFMNSSMDQHGRSIDKLVLASLQYFPIVVDTNQIRASHPVKGQSEGIYPHGMLLDGITNGNVTGNALIEAFLAQDAKRCG